MFLREVNLRWFCAVCTVQFNRDDWEAFDSIKNLGSFFFSPHLLFFSSDLSLRATWRRCLRCPSLPTEPGFFSRRYVLLSHWGRRLLTCLFYFLLVCDRCWAPSTNLTESLAMASSCEWLRMYQIQEQLRSLAPWPDPPPPQCFLHHIRCSITLTTVLPVV